MSEKKVTFGRIFWPSLWSALVVSIIGVLIWALVIGSLFSGFGEFGKSSLVVKDKTILHMELNGKIGEVGQSSFNPSTFTLDRKLSLAEILLGFEEAKKDDKIKGIFLEIGSLHCGLAMAKEIRDAIN
ncbi:MAG: hypothetical protein JKY09_01675, partial [Crocinitomicaceae bacterium]|nr:hypothetical protein [Crocinitomicaceae bacterium]